MTDLTCDCGHDGLDPMFHLRPCLIAEERARQRASARTGEQVTHRCKTCDTPVEVALVETTTQADLASGKRTFVWGRCEGNGCPSCGSCEYPALVIDDSDLLTQREVSQ